VRAAYIDVTFFSFRRLLRGEFATCCFGRNRTVGTAFTGSGRYYRRPTLPDVSPDGRWRACDSAELVARDKASLDIFWLKDDSFSDSDNVSAPEVTAAEIFEDVAALEQFREILADLGLEVAKASG